MSTRYLFKELSGILTVMTSGGKSPLSVSCIRVDGLMVVFLNLL